MNNTGGTLWSYVSNCVSTQAKNMYDGVNRFVAPVAQFVTDTNHAIQQTQQMPEQFNQTLARSLEEVQNTSKNIKLLIDTVKTSFIGSLIGGAIWGMTGIGGLMPIGAFSLKPRTLEPPC